MSLGENIYKHRTSKNWSQTDLAYKLDVSRQSVSKWENDSAVPDLDKLIKMRSLFGVSIDELVFGDEESAKKESKESNVKTSIGNILPSFRVMAGTTMIVFGMVLFLLSIFWGDHLYFGEAFGELLSAVIVLVSLALVAPYNEKVLAVCGIIFFIYTVTCISILNISSIINYLFIFIASMILLVWFIIYGLHANKENNSFQ